MPSLLVGVLCYFILRYVTSTSSSQNRRSLLANDAYHHVTNLSIEISDIAGNMEHSSMIHTIVSKLNTYYHGVYGESEYNLSITSYTTVNDHIELTLTLYTKTMISRENVSSTQVYIDDHISSALYVVTITTFTESVNRGETNDLKMEILIPLSLLLFVIVFGAFWFWKWRQREVNGDGEAFLTNHYTGNEDNGMAKDQKGFETIDLNLKEAVQKDNEENEENEMVKSIQRAKADVDDEKRKGDTGDEEEEEEKEEEDNESQQRSEHQEDDEKAEEIDLTTTTEKVGEKTKSVKL